jgi:hypothetical protein
LLIIDIYQKIDISIYQKVKYCDINIIMATTGAPAAYFESPDINLFNPMFHAEICFFLILSPVKSLSLYCA